MLPLADALDVTERIGYIWPPARRLQHFNKNQGKRGLIKLRNFQESKRRPVCKCRGLGEKHAKVLPPRGIFKLQSIVSVWLFQVSRNRNRPTWRLEGKKSENQFEFRSNSRLHFFCLSSSSEPTSSSGIRAGSGVKFEWVAAPAGTHSSYTFQKAFKFTSADCRPTILAWATSFWSKCGATRTLSASQSCSWWGRIDSSLPPIIIHTGRRSWPLTFGQSQT